MPLNTPGDLPFSAFTANKLLRSGCPLLLYYRMVKNSLQLVVLFYFKGLFFFILF